MRRCCKPVTTVSPFAFLMGALLLLTLPLPWLAGAVAAAGIHEAGHLLAIRLLGADARKIQVGSTGAKIHTCFSDPWREFLCAAAGPAAGLLLLLAARWFPRIAVCGLVQSIYNLLPVYPLDGGRMLFCVLEGMAPGKAEKLTQAAGQGMAWLLLTGALAAILCRQPGIALLLGATALRSGALGKIPCKRRGKAVQ